MNDIIRPGTADAPGATPATLSGVLGQGRSLIRVPAHEVAVGDRMGDGRWQGVPVVHVHLPAGDRKSTSSIDPEIVRIHLGSHGRIVRRTDARILVERAG